MYLVDMRLEDVRKDTMFYYNAKLSADYYGVEIPWTDPYNPALARVWWSPASGQGDTLSVALPDIASNGGYGSSPGLEEMITDIAVARILKTGVAQ